IQHGNRKVPNMIDYSALVAHNALRARCRSDVTRAIQLAQCEAIARDAMRAYRPHGIAWQEYMGADQDGPSYDNKRVSDAYAFTLWRERFAEDDDIAFDA